MLDYDSPELKLRFVRLYFYATTFDRMTFTRPGPGPELDNHQGQSSQVCRHVVSYWRNHGTPHWVLHYQCCGDCIFWNEDYT